MHATTFSFYFYLFVLFAFWLVKMLGYLIPSVILISRLLGGKICAVSVIDVLRYDEDWKMTIVHD